MKNFKKLFSMAAIVAIVGTFAPVATLGAATYSEELEGAYDYAYNNGITTMSSIDNADMYGSLTRIAMAKMMANYAVEVLGKTPDTTKECSFPDVSEELDAQYDNGVTKACQLGLMGVGIDNFNPNGLVTRAEFGTVLSRALYGDANNGGTPYYADHLAALKDAGIMNNIDNPSMLEVRGYVMLMMQRADTTPSICELPENVVACGLELDTCPAECANVTPVVPGFVTVSAVGSMSTQNVAKNAVDKNIGKIKITAGENDSTVSSVVIKHSGLGNDGDIENIKLSLNGVDATNERNISSSTHTATLRFTPALELKAGSSMTFDVLVSLSGAENNRHDFAVQSVNVVNGTAAGLPFDLGSLLTTSYAVGVITTDIVGGFNIKAGDLQQTIFTLQLTPNKAANVNGFTITKDAGEDFTKVVTNVKAYYNDVVVGNVVVENEKLVVNGLDIDRLNSESATIYLKADGIYIGTNGNLTGSIAVNDVVAFEQNTNEAMRSTSDAGVLLNVGNVDMTLTKMSTGSTTVAPGTSSVELLNVKLSANSEFEVSKFYINFLTGQLNLASFVDNKVTAYVDGVDYEITTGSTPFAAAADRFLVNKGDSAIIRVVGNLLSTATTGKDYQMEFGVTEVKNADNGNTITSLTFKKAGDIVTVNNGTFTVSKPTSIPTNKTVLEGSTADMLYFNIKASSENQTLKSVKVTSTVGFTGFATQIALMQGTTVVATENDEVDLSGTNYTFANLSRSLIKDTSVPFTIRVTLKNGEVENLGAKVKLSIAAPTTDVVIHRSGTSTPTTTSSTTIVGTEYQISSSLPTIAFTEQVDKNTTVQFGNTSNYDVQFISGTFEMTANRDGSTFIDWIGTGRLLESINGNVISVGGTIPGPVTFDLSGVLLDNTTAERIIELYDPAHTVTDADYTLTAKSLTFKYLKRDNHSLSGAVITETYNVSK